MRELIYLAAAVGGLVGLVLALRRVEGRCPHCERRGGVEMLRDGATVFERCRGCGWTSIVDDGGPL